MKKIKSSAALTDSDLTMSERVRLRVLLRDQSSNSKSLLKRLSKQISGSRTTPSSSTDGSNDAD